MRYVNHNFMSNFMGGVNSKDVELTFDLWINEVSDLVIDSTDEVIALLNKTGVKADKTDSYEQLVDKILGNINSNSLLNKGISFLIAQQNGVTPEKNKNWKQAIDSIAEKYASLLKSTLGNSKIKSSIKSDMMEQIKTKSASSKTGNKQVVLTKDTVSGKRERNIKIAKYILGGIAVAAIIYFGLDWYKKNKDMSFENGGAIPPSVPNMPQNNFQAQATSPVPTLNPNIQASAPIVNNSNII